MGILGNGDMGMMGILGNGDHIGPRRSNSVWRWGVKWRSYVGAREAKMTFSPLK